MAKYIKNPSGGIHSVTDEHFEALHEKGDNGKLYLPHGWSEINEAEARDGNPALFGPEKPKK